MDTDESTPPPQPTQQPKQSLEKFVTWFKQPSNVLSLAAILAVIIVPWLDKVVKSDETLRAKVDALLTATNNLISINQQQRSSPLTDPIDGALLAARRENELTRASAIARSIEYNVSPGVLFALSSELCASGNEGSFDEAQHYLRHILGRGTGIHFLSARPSNMELAEAHVVSGRCYAEEFRLSGKVNSPYSKQANYEMAAALAILSHDDSDLGRGRRAVINIEWAEVDERMGNTKLGQAHRQQAREITKQMRFVEDPLLALNGLTTPLATPPPPPPPPMLKDDNLPRSASGDTYRVTFPDSPTDVAALLLENPKPDGTYYVIGTLYLYRRGLFTEEDDVDSKTRGNSSSDITALAFTKTIPKPSLTGGALKVVSSWTVENVDKDSLTGVESRLGQAPRRFLAHRLTGRETIALTTTPK
jgi:hypothetical protein